MQQSGVRCPPGGRTTGARPQTTSVWRGQDGGRGSETGSPSLQRPCQAQYRHLGRRPARYPGVMSEPARADVNQPDQLMQVRLPEGQAELQTLAALDPLPHLARPQPLARLLRQLCAAGQPRLGYQGGLIEAAMSREILAQYGLDKLAACVPAAGERPKAVTAQCPGRPPRVPAV